MQVISAISWNKTPFYFDNDRRTFIIGDHSDLSLERFHCAESDLEWAKEVATNEGMNPENVKLESLDPETFTIN